VHFVVAGQLPRGKKYISKVKYSMTKKFLTYFEILGVLSREVQNWGSWPT
jgi:hypothetical protein